MEHSPVSPPWTQLSTKVPCEGLGLLLWKLSPDNLKTDYRNVILEMKGGIFSFIVQGPPCMDLKLLGFEYTLLLLFKVLLFQINSFKYVLCDQVHAWNEACETCHWIQISSTKFLSQKFLIVLLHYWDFNAVYFFRLVESEEKQAKKHAPITIRKLVISLFSEATCASM